MIQIFEKKKTNFNIKTEEFESLIEVVGKATLVIYLVWKIEGKLAKLWMMAFAYLSTCNLFYSFPSPHWKVNREGIVRS